MMRKVLIGCIFALVALELAGQYDPGTYQAFSRLDFYSDEKEGEIAVFIPAGKEELAITIDLVFEFQFLNRGFQVVPHGFSAVPLPMESLRAGDNEITVSFYEDQKWVDSRKVNVRVQSRQANEVKVDRISGLVICAGLPVLPMGQEVPLSAGKDLLNRMAGEGFTLVSTMAGEMAKACRGKKTSFLDHCDALGIRVSYNLAAFALADGIPGFSAKEKGLLLKEVARMKEHPALLGWILAEDPVPQGVSPDTLEKICREIKQIDPYHPVAARFKTAGDAIGYLNALDMVILTEINTNESMDDSPALASMDVAGIPVWRYFTREETDTVSKGQFANADMALQIYTGLCHGASGFLAEGPGDMLMPDNREFIDLLPLLASGSPIPPLTVSDRDLTTRMLNMNGLFSVIMVNNTEEKKAFSFHMHEIDLTLEGTDLASGELIRMEAGIVNDSIPGRSTNIYLFDSRMKPDWKKFVQPGNLTLNPGFEERSGPAWPANIYAANKPGNGSAGFLDGRIHKEGDQSLRLSTTRKNKGMQVRAMIGETDPDKSYTVSVWATAWKGMMDDTKHPPVFRMGIGMGHGREFQLTEKWEQYFFTVAGSELKADESGIINPSVELISKGTAWFDLLQVYPGQ